MPRAPVDGSELLKRLDHLEANQYRAFIRGMALGILVGAAIVIALVV